MKTRIPREADFGSNRLSLFRLSEGIPSDNRGAQGLTKGRPAGRSKSKHRSRRIGARRLDLPFSRCRAVSPAPSIDGCPVPLFS